MSINTLKNLVEAQDQKIQSNIQMGVEFYKKTTYFSFAKKIINNYQNDFKKILILNFDILFYKYMSSQNLENGKKIEMLEIHNLAETQLDNSKLVFFNCFNLKNEKENYKLWSAKISKANEYSIIIIGLDLLDIESINCFFFVNRRILNEINNKFFVFSIDSSSNNLNEANEMKKNLIKSKIDFYVYEKLNKVTDHKQLLYMEVYNLKRLTKDIAIFEFVKTKSTFDFEKIYIYLKEFKDQFEALPEAEIEPISTFKLSLNDKELQAKNDIILPYLKSNQNHEENRIVIDQEDLNELYEEDPDGDLDI